MLRYEFDGEDLAAKIGAAAPAAALADGPAAEQALREALRRDTVGIDHIAKTPFGVRRVVYADFTASGRALGWIEGIVRDKILPAYANTHTLSTATARQTTFYRSEARQVVKHYLNATHDDALIFCGAGVTGAVHKFVDIMCRASWALSPHGAEASAGDGSGLSDGYLREDRWGSYECTLCGVRLKTEAMYRAHRYSEMHQSKLQDKKPKDPFSGVRRVVVMCDPLAHHSSLLPFRELTRRYVHATTEPVLADSMHSTTGPSDPSGVEMEVCTIGLDASTGMLDEADFTRRLQTVAERKGTVSVCILSAGSNVTGLLADVPRLTALVHSHGGIACWDYAAAAGHARPDLNPPSRPDAAVDVAFFSPHKLLGGPGASGMLVAKKCLLRNAVPAIPGGGVVFFVDPKGHSYIQNAEDREEAGTPDIVGCIRAGLVHHVQTMLPESLHEVESRGLRTLLDRWAQIPRIEILGDAATSLQSPEGARRAAILSLMIRYGNGANGDGLYLHYNYVCALLNDLFGIQARGGCACAGPYGQCLLGIDSDLATTFDRCLARSAQEVLRPGFVRVGVHFTMADEEVELIGDAMAWIAEHGWRLLPAYTFSVETGEWHHRLATPQQDREWLSSFVPAALQSSPLKALESTLAAQQSSTSSPPADLIAAADAAVAAAYRGDNPIPLSSTRCPTLDAEYADLVWFALPTDAAAVLRSGSGAAVAPSLALEGAIFAGETAKAGRPSNAIFSVLQRRRSLAREAREDGEADVSTAPPASEDKADPFGEVAKDMDAQNSADPAEDVPDSEQKTLRPSFPRSALRPKVSKQLRSQVAGAIKEYGMINEGDRLLVGLSGGKDSLTMLHVLLELQRRAPVKFTVAAATVNPETPEYSPQPLIEYMKALGVEYHFLSKPLIEMAKCHLDPKKPSICSFCARMKRGLLYTCMREHGYNVLCLGQHLDDFAESFLMSAFRNGALRTMKANYFVEERDLRVCRPLVNVREKTMAQFATENQLPIIADNCPACFAVPKERHRVKLLLSQQEFEHPDLFWSLLKTMKPLIAIDRTERSMDWWRQGADGGAPAAGEFEDDGDMARGPQQAKASGKKSAKRGGAPVTRAAGGDVALATRKDGASTNADSAGKHKSELALCAASAVGGAVLALALAGLFARRRAA